MRRPLAIGLILALAPAAAAGAETVPGPVNARVVSVYDGGGACLGMTASYTARPLIKIHPGPTSTNAQERSSGVTPKMAD